MKQLIRLLINLLPVDMANCIYRTSLKRVYADKDSWKLSYYVSKKKYAKCKYVVLRFGGESRIGIFGVLRTVLFSVDYWEKRHYKPVIDLEDGDYLESGNLGEHNKWENCFRQVSVREVMRKDYVLVEDLGRTRALMSTCRKINGNFSPFVGIERDEWRDYYKKVNRYLQKWLRKSNKVQAVLEKDFYSKIKNSEKVLGVLMREEFSEEAYEMMPEERKKVMDIHPRVPNTDKIVEMVEDYIEKYKIDKIFLSTAHIETLNKFLERFGERIFYIDRKRTTLNLYRINQFGLSDAGARESITNEWGDTEIEVPVKYVSEIYALSECQYLIGVPCGGLVGAMMLNGGKYDDIMLLEDLNLKTENYSVD